MTAADLSHVERVGALVHPDFFERPEVFAERLALYPAGAFVTASGYALAHPARRGRPPALDTLLGALAAPADALHVHDIALLPGARGQGLGAAAMALFRALARREGLACLSLVSVHGTAAYWARFGFVPAAGAVDSYGPDAVYMLAATPG